jgi:hypothetical protein
VVYQSQDPWYHGRARSPTPQITASLLLRKRPDTRPWRPSKEETTDLANATIALKHPVITVALGSSHPTSSVEGEHVCQKYMRLTTKDPKATSLPIFFDSPTYAHAPGAYGGKRRGRRKEPKNPRYSRPIYEEVLQAEITFLRMCQEVVGETGSSI